METIKNTQQLETENQQLKETVRTLITYTESYEYWNSQYGSNQMTIQRQAFAHLKGKINNAKNLLEKFGGKIKKD